MAKEFYQQSFIPYWPQDMFDTLLIKIGKAPRLFVLSFSSLFAALHPFYAYGDFVNRDPTEQSRACDDAARTASYESGIPLDILQAITRTETGRTEGGATQPWPWTVNMEGRGVWFDTRAEALAFVFDHFNTGSRSFDIGCFQINYRWHGAEFSSIEDMFDPLANARYAAKFLNSLYQESGDWKIAAGAFHSRTEVYADRYMIRFNAALEDLEAPNEVSAERRSLSTFGARVNRFPLLQPGGLPSLASLVPLQSSQETIPIIDFPDLSGN